MPHRLFRIISVAALVALASSCTREPDEQQVADDLLAFVPADTPYVMVTSKLLPETLRDRLGDYYVSELAAQRAAMVRMREQVEAKAAPEGGPEPFFDVLDAVFAEFEGRDSVADFRELGFEPLSRFALYGIGPLPALRFEILDAGKLNVALDRIEERAGMRAERGELDGQVYRRFRVGGTDIVLAVSERHLIAGMLAHSLFERDLPLLLGQRKPEQSLAASGGIKQLIDEHGFAGYGDGYMRLDELLSMVFGEGAPRNREVMRALGADLPPVSDACLQLTRHLVSGMPRVSMGVMSVNDESMTARGIWEASPGVSAYLQKLAAPVPGVGASSDALLSFGMGLDLPQLRNAIEALLRQVTTHGGACEWVNKDAIQAVMPQLNLALGPMTAGLKGFNLHIEDIEIDPQTMQPVNVDGGVLAAVDDPRGIFALGAMFNPALAALEVPMDGSFVDLPSQPGLDDVVPPVRVAIRDKALVLVTGQASGDVAEQLSQASAVTPSPLFVFDYGVRQLVERFGELMVKVAARMESEGQQEVAAELREQSAVFARQAKVFDRVRMSTHASAKGLVMDQVMELR